MTAGRGGVERHPVHGLDPCRSVAPQPRRPSEVTRLHVFATPARGKPVSMTEESKRTNQQETTATAQSKARRTAGQATATASRAAKDAAQTAGDAASGTRSGAERVASTASGAASDAAQTAAKGVEMGRKAIVAASGQVASTARTAWAAVAHRKIVAAGVGVGLSAVSAASYAVGRRSARQAQGPITRLTSGRI